MWVRLQSLGHEPLATLAQTDTYVAVPRGRLKMRSITAGDGAMTAELIAYHRPDQRGPRWSSYTRVPLDADAAAGVLAALSETAGLLTRIEKRRTVVFYKETRIHLDEVTGLGTFIELETVLGDRSLTEAEAEYAAVVDLLGLAAFEPVAGSYSDLMMASATDENRQEGATR